MLSSLLAKFKEKKPEEEEELEKAAKKSASGEEFLRTTKAKTFVRKWSIRKDKKGRRIYTKRGIMSLLSAIFRVSGIETDEEVFDTADDILLKLRGMDGLQGFLMGWKAKSEGLMKGFASILKKAA